MKFNVLCFLFLVFVFNISLLSAERQTCEKGFGLVETFTPLYLGLDMESPDIRTEHSCQACSDEHCLYCDGHVGVCKVCEDDYRVHNGKCVPDCFDGNCADCSIESLGTCKSCQPGFAKKLYKRLRSSLQECYACEVENCANCDNGLESCDVCESGFEKYDSGRFCVVNTDL